MKTFQWNLRKLLALPLLICVCVISFFGGILSLRSQRNVAAETTVATEYVNLAEGKTYTAPTHGNSYTASLTDGVADTSFNYGDKWYGINKGTESGLKWYETIGETQYCVGAITIDLTKTELFSKVRIHLYNLSANDSCKVLLVRSSLDGETWTNLGNPAVKTDAECHGAYWTELAVETTPARYVQVQAMYDISWCFLNEIEVLAAAEIQEENVAFNADVEAPVGGNNYTASLTDGIASDVFDYGANWYGLNWTEDRSVAGNLVDANGNNLIYGRLGTMIIDLGENKQISKVRMHLYNLSGQGIVQGLAVYTSTDKTAWTHQGNPTVDTSVSGAYWTEHTVSANTRYVKVVMVYNTTWGFINEIEVIEEAAVGIEACDDVIVGEIEAVSSNNLASGKAVYGLADELGGATALSTLTDGLTPGGWQYGINGVNHSDLEQINGIKVNYLTLDLGEKKSWSGVKVHGYVESGSGIFAANAIYVAASNDTLTWTENKALTIGAVDGNNRYWAGAEDVLPTTTSRFVRIGIAGNGWTSIDEIEVYESKEPDPIVPYTNNVASFATVTAATSSNPQYYNGWDKLADGITHESPTYDNTTYGMNGSNINWVTFAFDKNVTWNTVRIHYIINSGSGIKAPKALYVAHSNNNEEYTEWSKLDTSTATVSAWAEFTDKEVKSKYVRIGVELQGWGFIDEVEIFAKKPYVTHIMGCEKLALNAEVEAPVGGDNYTASLTDGIASDVFDYGANWYGLNWTEDRSVAGNLVDANGNNLIYGRLGTMIIDLGENKQISKVRMHLYNLSGQGIVQGLAVYTSTDKTAWTHQGNPTVDTSVSGAYWTEHTVSANTRYVKVVMAYNTTWGFINEIEVYGEHMPKAVDEKPATLYAEGVKAHYACECCGATYLYNESEDEYTEVNAEDLRIERLTGFLGASMTLNNNLDFNFHASVGGKVNSVQVAFTVEDKETVVDGIQDGAEYRFVLKNLGPQNIGKEITARLLVDGVEKEVKTYSAHEYLYDVFKQSDEVGKYLIADIFEYGAAAQAYLGDTSTPVNTLYADVAEYKTEFIAPTETDKNVGVNATVDGYTFNAVNLKISSEVQMLFKFTAGANYKLIVNDVDVTANVESRADGSFVYYTNGISVVDFDEIYKEENIGEHGLCKIRGGDWLDTLSGAGLLGKGESLMITCQLVMSLGYVAKITAWTNCEDKISEDKLQAYMLRKARFKKDINTHCWSDKGFYNAVYTDNGEWIFSDKDPDGECRPYIPTNSYAILADVCDREEEVVETLKTLKREHGYCLFYPPMGKKTISLVGKMGTGDLQAGFGENGNPYNHGSHGFFLRALAHIGDYNTFYDVLNYMLPQNPAYHAPTSSYAAPYAIINVYQSVPMFNGRAGFSFLTGSVAMLHRAIYHWMAGVEFCFDGIAIQPCIPKQFKNMEIEISLADGKRIKISYQGYGNAVESSSVGTIKEGGLFVTGTQLSGTEEIIIILKS